MEPEQKKERNKPGLANNRKIESFPHGSCLFNHVWQGDPTHALIKFAFVAMTLMGLMTLPFLPRIVMAVFELDGEWDEKHGVFVHGNCSGMNCVTSAILVLLEKSMALSPVLVRHAFTASLSVYSLLIFVDVVLGDVIGCHEPWPKSWDVVNRQCYNDMFVEPARHGRLIRRPGNTLSNIIYFFFSLCLMLSIYRTTRVTSNSSNYNSILTPSDGMFAIMLLLLSLFSTLWHSSNSNWVHYFDLWSMDCCVLYLNIRNFSIAEFVVLRDNLQFDTFTAQCIAAWSSALIFAVIIVLLGILNFRNYELRLFHGAVCPLSVRSRLMKISNLWGRGHTDVVVGNICGYASLPIIYILVTSLFQVSMFHTVGSSLAGSVVCFTLSFAWSYRMFEQFALDGCIPATMFAMEMQNNNNKKGWMIVGAAISSPTAVLHIMTGVTLMAGYIHSRSLEEYVVWC